MQKRKSILAIILLLSLNVCFSQSTSHESKQLVIFHAGSLAVPFERILGGFKKENPGIEVVREIAGSIFASADYQVIESLLIPDYATWNLRFATNEMTIVYTDRSRRSNELNQKNWYTILLDKDIAFGRADPNADPCGYRTVLTTKLAEIYYRQSGLADRMLNKNTEHIRPKEVDLLALLEAGELDYIFLYRSVAEQHHLKYLILPDEINLKKGELETYYQQVSVELSGKAPGETINQTGGAMVYGVTIPNNSPHPDLAAKFIHYLMDKRKGLRVLEDMGQPSAVPSECAQYTQLPSEFRIYAVKKNR
jgi:molybdate/tungstate transport system substrate-binding protein